MATIETQVQDFKDNVASQAPPEIGGVFTREQAMLAQTSDRDAFVKPGAVLADFTLPDATGNEVGLGDLLADGPAVIVFYRGAWCPYCNIMMAAYRAELAPALAERGVALAAISPQLPDGSLTMQEKHELDFPVLSDPAGVVGEPLGIMYASGSDVVETGLALGNDLAAVNGQDEVRLPMPTVLLVDADRVVRFADVHPDYTQRTEVADILAAVDRLAR